MTHVIADDAEAVAVAPELAAKFAREAAQRDAERIPPHTELDELSDSGLLGITVPRSHGGAEASARTLGEVVRLLSAADSSIGQIPQNHYFFVEVLKENGTAQQRDFRRPRRPRTAQPRQAPGPVRRRHAPRGRRPAGRGSRVRKGHEVPLAALLTSALAGQPAARS